MDKFLEFLSAFNAQTLIGMTVIMWYFTREMRKEIREDINSIRQETAAQSARSDKLYEAFQECLTSTRREIETQGKRSDKLYEMFIELLKERKNE